MPYITIGKKGLEEEIKILKEKNIEDYYLESSELREVLEIVKGTSKNFSKNL